MKTLLIALTFAGSLAAQTTVTVPIGNIIVPNEAAAAYESWRLTQTNGPATTLTLTADITISQTTFAVTGTLTQLAALQQVTIDGEVLNVVSIAGQNLTVAARALYAIGGITISTPAIHTAGTPIVLLKWASAVAGFKQLISGSVQQVIATYCPSHPTTCPTLTTQYNAITSANATIAAIMAVLVQ